MSADTTFESNVNTNENDHNHSLTINYILLSNCKMAHCLVFIILSFVIIIYLSWGVFLSDEARVALEQIVGLGGRLLLRQAVISHTGPLVTIPSNTIPYNAIPYNAIQCHAMSYCTIPYHTKPNNTKKQPHHTDTSPHHTISGDKSHGSPAHFSPPPMTLPPPPRIPGSKDSRRLFIEDNSKFGCGARCDRVDILLEVSLFRLGSL